MRATSTTPRRWLLMSPGAVRKQATDGLAELGEAAESALKRMLEGAPPLEVRVRVENLLDRLQGNGIRFRNSRALAVLEDIDSAESHRLLQALAAGLPGARLTEEAQVTLKRVTRRASNP